MYLEITVCWSQPPSAALCEELEVMLAESGSVGWEEYGDLTQVGGRWRIYFEEQADIGPVIWNIQNLCYREGIDPPEMESGLLEDQDWTQRFRELFRPFRIPPCWLIAPPWESDNIEPESKEHSLIIYPGMAFGTGLHESTQLCLEVLPEIVSPGIAVLDIGAGSGVLSIAAAKLGARKIHAVEIDAQAEENLRHNIDLNNAGNVIEVCIGDFSQLKLPPADVALCNMIFSKFQQVADAVCENLADKGILLASGYLTTEKRDVMNFLKKCSFEITREIDKGEWLAFIAARR